MDVEGPGADAALLRALVERSADVLQVCDPSGLVRYCSPALREVLGWEPERVTGRHYRDLVLPQDAAAADAAFRAALEAPPRRVVEAELRAPHADGAPRWLALRTRNLTADPAVAGLLSTWRDVTGRHEAAALLEHQALHDQLTGLPNRRWFTAALARAVARAARSGRPAGVVLLDLDDFKLVNDTLGHPVGDDLLVQVARRISASLRPGDTAARLGGDEFVVLAEELRSDADALAVAERILASGGGEYRLPPRTLRVALSAGVATTTEAIDPDVLLARADSALYEAKRRGRGRAEVHTAGLGTRLRARARAGHELRDALERDRLLLHWQPVVRARDGEVTAAEALLRWQHPTRGLLAAAEFLPLAAEAGLTAALSSWAAERALTEAAAWTRGPRAPRACVNLAAQDLDHGGHTAAARLEALCASLGLDPGRVQLEVGERVLAQDPAGWAERLRALRARGFLLALDDFGAGGAVLAQLRRLPLDVVKLDRELTRELASPSARAVVASALQLAAALGVETVAEGVEDEQQRAVLVELGCLHLQGHHVARPAPAAALAEVLRRGHPARP